MSGQKSDFRIVPRVGGAISGGGGVAGLTASMETARLEYNQLLRDNPNGYDYILADSAADPRFQNPFDEDWYDDDHTHLNNAGYYLKAQKTAAVINTLLAA